MRPNSIYFGLKVVPMVCKGCPVANAVVAVQRPRKTTGLITFNDAGLSYIILVVEKPTCLWFLIMVFVASQWLSLKLYKSPGPKAAVVEFSIRT